MITPPEGYTELGRLGKTFQLSGGVRFYPLGEAEAQAMLQLQQVFLSEAGLSDIRQVRDLGGTIIVYFTRALTVEAAKPLVNQLVYAPQEALPRNDTPYVDALIGVSVFLEGALIGEVIAVIDASLQDVLVIETASGEVMVPLQAPYVAVAEDGVYLSDVPEGLV
jgi:16S rRNA processing protein RimM